MGVKSIDELFGPAKFSALFAPGDEIERLWCALRALRISLGPEGFAELLADAAASIDDGLAPAEAVAGVLAQY
ncbi:MAG TPA: hypothetical protein VK714_00680 [Myxococcota bacterium]|nr:hypothetical protein [Myxococcota bacterium]